MRPSEAKVVSLEGARPVDDAQKVRLGIASMTADPADLEQWLAYHRRVVGVEKFFLQIEDTPELAALRREPPWKRLWTRRAWPKLIEIISSRWTARP